MKQLKYISLACALLICMVGKGQEPPHFVAGKGLVIIGNVIMVDTGYIQTKSDEPVGELNVMLKIVLRRKTSVHFYREGYKRDEEYWIIDGQRIRPLPKSWFVWEFKEIKR